MINRRPAPRSRELLCTDGVVERVAAHHAHALGRQRHAGTEQGLHVATKNVSPRASNCVGKSRCFTFTFTFICLLYCFGRVLLQQALLASIWWPSFVGGSSPARSLFRTFDNSIDRAGTLFLMNSHSDSHCPQLIAQRRGAARGDEERVRGWTPND